MNISLNWLKEYLKIDLSVEKVCEILTSIGLEVGGYEKFESIRGGLRGLVIGEVKTCEAHPDSDHLHLTTVDLGDGRWLHQAPARGLQRHADRRWREPVAGPASAAGHRPLVSRSRKRRSMRSIW